MIQLTSKGLTGSAETELLSREFEHLHTFRMPGLIHSGLMKLISARLEQTNWTVKVHQGVGSEVVPEDQIAVSILQFAVNSPGFLEAIRNITGCAAISGYKGRIYRFAGEGHSATWHDDAPTEANLRMVGMSVNLATAPYQGGVFRMRKAGTDEIVRELPNTGPGDAIFFRISHKLEHMVTPVEGEVPKTAYAGWFGASTFFPNQG
jgi:hypothetical protein